MTKGIAVELMWPIAPGILCALAVATGHQTRCDFRTVGDLFLATAKAYPMSEQAPVSTIPLMGEAAPADWQPGEDVIVPPAGSCGTAEERVQGKEAGIKCHEWSCVSRKSPSTRWTCRPSGQSPNHDT